ncbi:hypothetical protein IMSHALPRED_001099 [Imshaugia aleurites]|uniref:Uncharacterized protein n=1 Tax=Imshaugia aleurites TaxID=172621 RepID=A0A8H3J173_9LECA|nr:hypothetical protein IMSHALPRED_001099 [Imshaugia aleurites]
MQWGPDADAKLFMHVLKIHNVKIDYNALAMAMGNDVTPKALTHRIAKLRSMADDASTPVAGAPPGLGLPQPTKRSPAKRAPASPATAGKKGANATTTTANNATTTTTAANAANAANANKSTLAGTKRNAAGAAKGGNGNGKTNAGSPLTNVVAADGDGVHGNGVHGEAALQGGVEMPAKKKAKSGGAAMRHQDVDAEADGVGVVYQYA